MLLRTAVSVSLLLSSFATGQTTQQGSSSPTFTTTADYVEVPVIVKRSGKHVPGLRKEDFVLQQDGAEQPIVFFEEVRRGEVQSAAPADPVADSHPLPWPQVTIIAIDLVNTPNLERAYFEKELTNYLKKADWAGGVVGVVAIERSGIRLVHDFTSKPETILASLHQQGTPQKTANDDKDWFAIELADDGATGASTTRTAMENMVRFQDRAAKIDELLTIQQLAQALKGIPGRKSLLLVGSGFKLVDTMVTLAGDGTTIKEEPYQARESFDEALYTWKLLNDANVAVYPIDTRRTFNPAYQAADPGLVPEHASPLTQRQIEVEDHDIIRNHQAIAAETGGKPCFYRTDLGNCVREAVQDNEDYYLLGFAVDKHSHLPGWHRISLNLKQKATLRYRQGFLLADFNPEAARKNDIALALNSPVAYTGVPFRARVGTISGTGERKTAEFAIAIPPGSLNLSGSQLDLNVVAYARAAGGRHAGEFTQHIARALSKQDLDQIGRTGIDYIGKIDLPAGEYAVWIVVRDNIGNRTGSALLGVKVP